MPNPNNGDGPYYLGNSSLVVSSLTGVIYIFNGTDANFSLPQSQIGNNQLSLSDYYVDVTTSGDSFLVTYWVA